MGQGGEWRVLDEDGMLWMVVWAGELWWERGRQCEGWGGRMNVTVWDWLPLPMNQRGHHCSYTCVKSRAQVIRGEQMLHLHEGS